MKNCDSLFCSNKCPEKFSYCKPCAKRKGLIDGEPTVLQTIVGIIVFVAIISYLF